MKLYTAAGSKANREACIRLGVGVLLVDHWRDPSSFPFFAVDNGCFSAWKRGVDWSPGPFLSILTKCKELHLKPDFAVLPDIIEGGNRSLRKSLTYLNLLLEEFPDVPFYLAVQDGMDFEELPHPAIKGLFVGGSMKWKLETMGHWAKVAHKAGISCHVGRVGTPERMELAHLAGVDSIDSTTWVQRNGCLEHHVTEYAARVSEDLPILQQMCPRC